MGFGKATLKIYGKLFKEGFFNEINSVMELGSQQISDMIKDISLFDFIEKKELINLKSKSTKQIYELLGVGEYESIDSNGEFGSHTFDLNFDINKMYGYKKQFDLVTNLGTSEHIFDQYNCFENIHNLTKTGGYMFHAVPNKSYITHSFYLYQYPFFTDLAESNHYEIKGMWISIDGEESVVPFPNNEKYLEGRKVLILCLLKKTTSDSFKIPFQEQFKKASKLK